MKEITITAKEILIYIYWVATVLSITYFLFFDYSTITLLDKLAFTLTVGNVILLIYIKTIDIMFDEIKYEFTFKIPTLFNTTKRDHLANYGELIQKGDQRAADLYYEKHIKNL